MGKALLNFFKLIAGIVFCLYLLQIFFIYPLDSYFEKYYRKRFGAIPNVISIENYMNYEGTRSLDLILEGNKKIEIWSSEYFSFTKNGWVGMSSIGGLELDCREYKSSYTSSVGIDVISFVNNSNLNFKIHSVEDLVKNYSAIYDYIASFPAKAESAKVVNMNNLTKNNKDHWCHVENVKEFNIGKELRRIVYEN